MIPFMGQLTGTHWRKQIRAHCAALGSGYFPFEGESPSKDNGPPEWALFLLRSLEFFFCLSEASHVPSTTTLLTYPADHTRRWQPCYIYKIHSIRIWTERSCRQVSGEKLAHHVPLQGRYILGKLASALSLSISFNMLICSSHPRQPLTSAHCTFNPLHGLSASRFIRAS